MQSQCFETKIVHFFINKFLFYFFFVSIVKNRVRPIQKTVLFDSLHQSVNMFLEACKLIEVFKVSKSLQAKVTLNI